MQKTYKKLLIPSVILVAMLLVGCIGGVFGIQSLGIFSQQEPEENVVTVLMPHVYLPEQSYMFIQRYAERYKEETGIQVVVERLTAGNYDRYVMKRNNRLYMKNGPTLLLIPYDQYAREFVDKGVALNIQGKIENQSKLYKGLVDEYYIPVKIHGKTVSINRELLEKLDMKEPELDWTLAEYDALWEAWSNSEHIYFEKNLFYDLVAKMTRDLVLFDPETNRVNLDNEGVIERILAVKEEVFSGKYIHEENYTYQNYHKMFYQGNSQESLDSWDKFVTNSKNNFIMNTEGHHYNGTSSPRSNNVFKFIPTSLLRPDVRGNEYFTIGFLVNRNGQNVDLGIDFLNYLISDRIQLDLFNREAQVRDSVNGPVNKNIAKEIETIEILQGILPETIALTQYMTNRLEENDYRHIFYGPDAREDVVQKRFINELIRIVFADEALGREEISRRLKRAENELYIYINE